MHNFESPSVYHHEYIEIYMTFQFQDRIKIPVEHINNISNTSITKVDVPGSKAHAHHAPRWAQILAKEEACG